MAIQVCYSLDENAYDKEITGLLKMEERLPVGRRLVVSLDEEREIETMHYREMFFLSIGIAL